MKKILPIIVAACCLLSASAQEKSPVFNLKDYKYRYQKYQGLGFNGGLGQDLNKINSSQGVHYGNLGLNGNYLLSQSSNRWQQGLNVVLDLRGNYNSSGSSTGPQTYVQSVSRFNPGLTINSNNRYFIKGKTFVEGNIYVNTNPSFSKYGETAINNKYYHSSGQTYKKSTSTASVAAGHGRLEMVTDAATAMFMLKALEKAGCLSRELNKEDVLLLSQIITRQNNFRFFDTRMKRIRQLQLVDSVLQSRGLIKTNSIQNFAILNDNLFFTNLAPRSAGSMWSVNASTSYFGNRNVNNFEGRMWDSVQFVDSASIRSSWTNRNSIGFNYTKNTPINLYWQRALSISLTGSQNKSRNLDEVKNYFSNTQKQQFYTSNMYLSYVVDYTPTTRTRYRLSMTNNTNFNFRSGVASERIDNYTNFMAEAFRWISPRYQVHASIAGSFFVLTNGLQNVSTGYMQGVDAGFTYFMY